MPLDLRVARASGVIPAKDFHELMARAPGARKGEHLYWITAQGEPWFAAEWEDDEIRLSTSHGYHRFLRNVPTMFDMGLRIADALDAELVEEAGGREVTRDTLAELLAPGGPLVKRETATFRAVQEKISAEGQAPLEFPLAGVDVVPEYFLFYVVGGGDSEVTPPSKGVELVAAAPGAWLLEEGEGAWLTRVLRRDDGTWQIWPAWGRSSFARIAEVTLAAAEQLVRATGGELRYLGEPCPTALREEIRARSRGLGVDFYEWSEDR